MIFHLNKKTNSYQAIWEKNSVQHIYDCSFSACDNPCCTCTTLDVDMALVSPESGGYGQEKTVVIDVMTCSLGTSDSKRIVHDDLAFSEMFIELLDRDDFDLLLSQFHEFKYHITEKGDITDVDIRFDYHDIDVNGTMICYNDLLPNGEKIILEMGGKRWMVLDQHCVRQGCNCGQVYLDFFRFKSLRELDEDFFSLSLEFKKRQWAEHAYMENSPISFKEIRQTIEDSYPDFYQVMSMRQTKLKAIYGQSKKKYAKAQTETKQGKVGRNDPCPCGSGKKYKKCCMK